MRIPETLHELHSMRAELDRGQLSLSRIEEIAEKAAFIAKDIFENSKKDIYSSVVDSIFETANQVFQKALDAKHSLIMRDVQFLKQISGLEAEVMALWIEENEMNPDQIKEKLAQMRKQVVSLERKKLSSPKVLEQLESLKKKIQKLMFAFDFPLLHELVDHPGTFAHTLHTLAVEA